MKLSDCHLSVTAVVTAPFEHSQPEESWSGALARGDIPEELWAFYRSTRYLSSSALAGSSTPEERLVTVYFSRLIRSIKDCFVDISEHRSKMRVEYPRQYDPLEPARDREFHRDATRLHRAAFRSLLTDLLIS